MRASGRDGELQADIVALDQGEEEGLQEVGCVVCVVATTADVAVERKPISLKKRVECFAANRRVAAVGGEDEIQPVVSNGRGREASRTAR